MCRGRGRDDVPLSPVQSELYELICTVGQLDAAYRVSGTVRGCGLRTVTASPMRVEGVELDAIPSEHGTPPTKGKRELC